MKKLHERMEEFYGENHRELFTCDQAGMWQEAIIELKRLERLDPRNANDLTEK